ncbi:SDR family oxidoreductase [Taibaiella soli]|uniref:Short-chain dehydrogenase n=1 Tax=Taibaiella soli TaxID=1649169 RepID=A0A2W2AF78_9BACT|nr:SDR family oxidoreductase [Taibaiella soli]PZF74135.1 short-chain dehydrogenase [Taibaiella soli]
MNKTIFITGTSSGLGKASAKYFAENGWNVAATMRSPEKETELTQYQNVKIYKLDVTNISQVKTAVADAIKDFGKIDVVLNNAGMGVYGALELAKEEDIDWQFAVNARGPINVIRAFLPHFRSNNGGMFINVSSFMGITTAVPLGSLYNMSKFALEGLTEGLYYELKPFNIDLRLIEQGGSSGNNFVNNMVFHTDSDIKAYDPQSNALKQMFENVHTQLKEDTMDIVCVIADLAERRSNKFRTVIGESGNHLMSLRQSLPIEEYLETVSGMFV